MQLGIPTLDTLCYTQLKPEHVGLTGENQIKDRGQPRIHKQRHITPAV